MALPDEIQAGKTYVNPRWKGARTVKRLEQKRVAGVKSTVVHYVDARARTGSAEIAHFARNASVQDLLSDQTPKPAARRPARLTKSQLRKIASKAGIFRVDGDEGEALMKQLAAFAAGVAAHYAAKCKAIALEHQQQEGTYAAGKKAGALECAQALAL